MPALEGALAQVGVNLSSGVGAALSLAGAVDEFTQQNLTPSDVADAAKRLNASLLTSGPVATGLNVLANSVPGPGGDWTSVHYADDLVAHQPKFKFLFKVIFEGFEGGTFYRYVHRVDKPRVQLNHTDVNYYNFRTRVLTSVTYPAISCTFLDEIGNTVSDFFVSYMHRNSGTGGGSWGIDKGFGPASSTKPYPNGYSSGKKITVEQIFANGILAQRYSFINPRIEDFQFDELNMEDNAGSMLTVLFTYDAIESTTVSRSTLYSWGNTDLLAGGGSSGIPNAGMSSIYEAGLIPESSANGNGIFGGLNPRTPQPGLAYASLTAGLTSINTLPASLADLATSNLNLLSTGTGPIISSAFDTVQTNASETLTAIQNGSNLNFGTVTETVSSAASTIFSGGFP